MGAPGKCYAKMMLNTTLVWVEILCPSEINKNLARGLHADLTRLNYDISSEELASETIGTTTKAAVKEFQIKNGMAAGNFDWATINRLSQEL